MGSLGFVLKVWERFLLEPKHPKNASNSSLQDNRGASSEVFFCDLTMEGLMTLIFDQ